MIKGTDLTFMKSDTKQLFAKRIMITLTFSLIAEKCLISI